MRTTWIGVTPSMSMVVFVLLFTRSVLANKIPESLPDMGEAPPFTLTTQDNHQLTLLDLRGKIAVVNFVFTRCAESCPMLVVKLLGVQSDLVEYFGRDVQFVSITLDAEHDNPEVLKNWADRLGADLKGWSFLTGTQQQIDAVIGAYGVIRRQASDVNIDHNLLTSIIDRNGILRVQYMGDRFDKDEFLQDIQSLMTESDTL